MRMKTVQEFESLNELIDFMDKLPRHVIIDISAGYDGYVQLINDDTEQKDDRRDLTEYSLRCKIKVEDFIKEACAAVGHRLIAMNGEKKICVLEARGRLA